MHPFGIDGQNDRFSMPLADFRGRLNSCGKVNIKPLAFQYALLHDGVCKPLGRAMIQNIWRNGFLQFHIHLNAVALPGTDARHVLRKLIPLLVVVGHYLAQFFHGETMIGHQVAHLAPAMLVEGV